MKTLAPLLSIAVALSSIVFLSGCKSTGGRVKTTGTISSDSRDALRDLYANNAGARALGKSATAVLVFPKVTKGGFIFGGMGGNGTLFYRGGGVGGYYQTAGVSWGLQAGVQQYGYALFLMDNDAIRKLNSSDGWEIGGAPSLVVVDEGLSKSLTTTTVRKGVYAFIFNQRGLMGGLTLEGTKITRLRL